MGSRVTRGPRPESQDRLVAPDNQRLALVDQSAPASRVAHEVSERFAVSRVRVMRSGGLKVTVTIPDAGMIQAVATHDDPHEGFAAAVQPTVPAPGWHRFAVLAPVAIHVAKGGRITITLRRSARARAARFVLRRIHIRLTIAFTPIMGATALHIRTIAVPVRA